MVFDNDIMMKVRNGETDRLGLLFERYNKQLFGFFFRCTHDKQSSEDMVQNVFYRILKYKKQFRGEGKFTTWMYSISRNILSDHYRKQNKNVQEAQLNEELAEFPVETSDEQEQEIKTLEKAICKLDAEKKELLILNRYQGMKYKELAELYDSTEVAIRVKVFRILNELRTIYNQLEKSGVI